MILQKIYTAWRQISPHSVYDLFIYLIIILLGVKSRQSLCGKSPSIRLSGRADYSMTFFCSHRLPKKRRTKNTSRTTQSIIIAAQTPNRPQFSQVPSTTEKPTRNTHMENMLTAIVYFASPAARRICGSVNEQGQKAMLLRQTMRIIPSARLVV